MSDQPTLPGMDRRPELKPELRKRKRRRRTAYDDTARGFVGLPHAKTVASKAAAEAMLPRAGRQRQRVYEYVHALGGQGATPDEVSEALDIPTTSAGPRFYELRNAGLLFKVDERRPTRAGGSATVHVAVEFIDTSVSDLRTARARG